MWIDACSVGAVSVPVPVSLPDIWKSMPVDNYLAHPEISCYGIGMWAYAPKTRAIGPIANQPHTV